MELEKWVVAIGIAVVLVAFASDVINLIYPSPVLSISNRSNDFQTYQVVSMIIYELLGIVLILIGFLAIRKVSIGSGLILAGIFIFFVGGVLSFFFSITSAISTLGFSDSGNGDIVRIIRIGGEAIVLILLFLLSYFIVEKRETNQGNLRQWN